MYPLLFVFLVFFVAHLLGQAWLIQAMFVLIGVAFFIALPLSDIEQDEEEL